MFVDWHQAPLVRIALAFIIGCGLAWTLPDAPALFTPIRSLYGLSVLILILLALVIFRRVWKFPWNNEIFGLLISFGFLLFGFAHTSFHRQWSKSSQISIPSCTFYKSVVDSPPMQKAKTMAYRLTLCGCEIRGKSFDLERQSILGYVPKESSTAEFNLGDTLRFEARIQTPQEPLNPGEFDFGAYLKKQGIVGTAYLSGNYHSNAGIQTQNLTTFFQATQTAAIQVFRILGIKGDALGVASALILGQRNLLEQDVRESFSSAGVVHILAVSGLHVGLLFIVIEWLLKLVLRQKRFNIIRVCLIIIFLWMYAGITGFSPSVLRAATMFSFIAIAKGGDRKSNIFNMLATSAFVLLLFNPSLLTEVGFQLSYMAVLGIVILHKPIYQLLTFRWWLIDKAWSLMVVSFVAQLATLPLITYYFGQFPTYFLLANLFVIPIATLILYLGLVVLLFSWLPVVNHFLALIFDFFIQVLIWVVKLTVELPFSKITGLYFDELMVAIIYAFLVFLVALLVWPSRRNLRFAQLSFAILVAVSASRTINRSDRYETWLMASSQGALPLLFDGSHAYLAFPDSASISDPNVLRSVEGFLRESQVRSIILQSSGVYHRNGWSGNDRFLLCGNQLIIDAAASADLLTQPTESKILFLVKPGSYSREKAAFRSPIILDNKLGAKAKANWLSEPNSSEALVWDMSIQGAVRLDQLDWE